VRKTAEDPPGMGAGPVMTVTPIMWPAGYARREDSAPAGVIGWVEPGLDATRTAPPLPMLPPVAGDDARRRTLPAGPGAGLSPSLAGVVAHAAVYRDEGPHVGDVPDGQRGAQVGHVAAGEPELVVDVAGHVHGG